jgi:glycosyltransferase involved in cell wall biosynthesis
VIHVHVKFGDWMGRGVRWAFGRADALIGVSDFVAKSMVLGGYAPQRTYAVPNAIDPTAWDPTLDPAPGRNALGLDAKAPLVLSVSRLFSWKGHTELIRALAHVKREIPDVRLAIVGSDYPPGSGVSAKLRVLAGELGVAENVVFAGHRSDVAALLAASEVFALPSFEEPFGLVFAEAMAMKRPVVALDNGGTPEVVRHGETGLLSRPGDIEMLASNLLQLLRDPSLRARMGEAGRRDVEARFTPVRLASDVENVYASLLEPRA